LGRKAKIKLLRCWLKNPESMGEIPKNLKQKVTREDIFDIKRDLKWKPPEPKSVSRLLFRYELGAGAGKGGFSTESKIVTILLILFFPLSLMIYPADEFTIIGYLLLFVGALAAIWLREMNK